MADRKPLVLILGDFAQVPDADTLIVGAGITGIAGEDLSVTTTGGGAVFVTSSSNLSVATVGGGEINIVSSSHLLLQSLDEQDTVIDSDGGIEMTARHNTLAIEAQDGHDVTILADNDVSVTSANVLTLQSTAANIDVQAAFQILLQSAGGTVDLISDTDNVNITAGGIVQIAGGPLVLSTVGQGLNVAEGANARQGADTLVGGTVTVSTTAVTANSRIFLTGQNTSGTAGELTVSARTAGTSFVITSLSALDTRLVAWEIFEPA